MSNENIFGNIPDSEEELNDNDRAFVDFHEAAKHQLEVDADVEIRSGENKYGKTAYYIDVEEAGVKKVWGITSTKVMIKLKRIQPLGGKTLSVERIGTGYETEHIIKVL